VYKIVYKIYVPLPGISMQKETIIDMYTSCAII